MKVSVALCTYNGARFLGEQLDSLLAQTRRPDELIVCDDASTDDTVTIVHDFSAAAPFAVKVVANPATIGFIKNFEKAIAECSGELIFLCDQDDVWLPEKIDAIEERFREDASPGLFFGNAQLVDRELKPLRRDLFGELGFDQRKQQIVKAGRTLDLLLRTNYICGATMAFRAAFKPLVLPIPDYGPLLHDGWIGLLLSIVGQVAFDERPLIKYRVHDQQQIGLSHVSTLSQVVHAQPTDREFYRNHARQLNEALTRVIAYGIDRRQEDLLKQKITHLNERAELPASQLERLGSISKEVLNLNYHRFSRGWFSAAKDLLA